MGSSPGAGAAPAAPDSKRRDRDANAAVEGLRDFSADRSLLGLSSTALAIGTGGAAVAWALSRLINIVTNLAYFGRWSASAVQIADHPLGYAAVLIPRRLPDRRPAGALRLGEDSRSRHPGSHRGDPDRAQPDPAEGCAPESWSDSWPIA